MATQTASTRQPFAPLNHSRLQNLTNLKNRQNALITPSTLQKRKATTFESDLSSTDNSENIDPIHFLSPKRSCPSTSPSTYTKPTNYFLTRAPPSPNFTSSLSASTPFQTRKILSPKARTATPRIDTSKKIIGSGGNGSGGIALSAPAGRSPTRKRVGILNRRKTGTPIFSRVEPPKFTLAGGRGSRAGEGGLGFSIDAALSGTIPSYSSSRPTTTSTSTSSVPEAVPTNDFSAIPLLHTESVKESWFFAIHEDTEEELATNLMEHSTCILDISSDEESSSRLRDERGKENIAPADDISQTRSSISSSSVPGGRGRVGEVEGNEMNMEELKKNIRRKVRGDENQIEIDREPLGALKAEDFYPEGCDESSVFIIPSSDHLPTSEDPTIENQELDLSLEKNKGIDLDLGSGAEEGMIETETDVEEKTIDELMSRDDSAPRKAALLQPIEKAEEGWTLWESGSVDGEEMGA